MRKPQKFLAMFLAAGMIAAGVTGCGQQGAGGTGTASVPESGAVNELVVAVGDMADGSYDACLGYGMYGTNIFYSSLVKIGKDIGVEKDLAKDYTISEDGLTYTFNLRDDVKFSDGEPLTAEDVVFTFETIKENASSVDVSMMDSVKAKDDYTVEFKLTHPFSPFLRTLALQGIVAKHAYGENYAANPVVSGPFKVKQLDVGQQLIVEANDYYYGTKTPFSQITFLDIDEETALSYAQAGTLDVVKINPEYAYEKVDGMHLETYATSDNRGFNLPCIPETTLSDGKVVGSNVTSDPAVRKALNIGVSRKTIIDNALNGIGTPAWVRFENLPWANMEPGLKDGQVDEACALLEDAGWVDEDGDGFREKDGVDCEFSITGRTDDLQRYNLAVAFAEDAKKLGIKINAEAKDWTTCKDIARKSPTCIGTGDYCFVDVYNAFHSSYGQPDVVSLSNSGMYQNDVVDGYLEEAMLATDDKTAIDLLMKAQYDGKTGPNVDFPYIWLVNIDHTYFIKDNVDVGTQMVHPHGHGTPIIQNLNEWTAK